MPHFKLVKEILVGETFGRWTVIRPPELVMTRSKNHPRQRYVPCVCRCGTEKLVKPGSLRSGASGSCGCLQLEKVTGAVCRTRTHGLSEHPLHSVWCAMKSRCNTPSNKHYKNYGAIGIKVCDEWSEFLNFYKWAIQFWKHGLDIDRADNSKGYSPDNCRFITRAENLLNRRNTAWINYMGERITVVELSRRINHPYHRLRNRLKSGMCAEDAVADLKVRYPG